MQRTAPNKKSSKSFQQKIKWSLSFRSSKQHDKWKLNQSRKSKYINIPQKNLHQTITLTLPSNQIHQSSNRCLRLSVLNFVTLSPRVSLQRGPDRVGSNSAPAASEATKLKSWERAIDPYSRHQVRLWVTMYMRIIYIDVYEIWYACVKSWCKLFFLQVCQMHIMLIHVFFPWTVHRSKI